MIAGAAFATGSAGNPRTRTLESMTAKRAVHGAREQAGA